jgi:glyoxylase-like metal-dependent hydrolase (beta-lactamase superfamily II)
MDAGREPVAAAGSERVAVLRDSASRLLRTRFVNDSHALRFLQNQNCISLCVAILNMVESSAMQQTTMLALWLGLITAPAALAQQPGQPARQPDNVVLREGATRQLSPHVFVIYGNPNIAIVVGTRASLVVDTGLGRRNGAFIADEAAKLTRTTRLFLTTTHAHPEHSSGQDGFPPDTIVIRPKAQQQDLDENGVDSIEAFRSRNATNRELLAGAQVGKSDILFDDELTVDLGDAAARLLWFGPAHSNGDTLAFIEPDGVLVSGDVVQNKAGIGLSGSHSTLKSWIAVVDKVAALKPALILPDHSLPGGGELIAEQRGFLVDLEQSIQALKRQGKSAEEAARQIGNDFQSRYAGWTRLNFLERSVIAAYREP